jgi:hypothetical protein
MHEANRLRARIQRLSCSDVYELFQFTDLRACGKLKYIATLLELSTSSFLAVFLKKGTISKGYDDE